MRNLVEYMYNYLDDNEAHYTDVDVSDRILLFEKGFREFAGLEGNMYSKELIEDIVFLTHMNKEENAAYVAASTLMNSDVMIRIPEPITDLQMDSNGINIFIEKDDKTFLGYKIFIKKHQGTHREVGVFSLCDYVDIHSKYPLTVFENLEDECILVYNTDGTIYLTDYKFNLLLDVSKEIEEVVEEKDKEKYEVVTGLYNHDLIGIRVMDKSIDTEKDFFTDNLLYTYVYSVSKTEVLQKFPDGVVINKLFNIDNMKDYTDKPFVWVTKSLFEWKPEYSEALKNGDTNKIQEIMELQSERTVNGLVPLYNVKKEDDFFFSNFVPMSTNANDIGDYIDGLQQFYTIDNNTYGSEFRYTYNFYTAKNNKIEINKIQSNTIPRKIYFSKDTSVTTFQYKVDGFDQIVSYWKDYGDIIKYSKVLIKDKDLNRIKTVVKEVEDHIRLINGGNENVADDEIKLMYNLLKNKEYYEDKDTTQLVTSHLSNLGTDDIGIGIESLSYGQDGRIITYKLANGTFEFKKRAKIGESLDDIIKEELEKNKEIEELYKDQEKKIEDDIKNNTYFNL